MKKEDKIKLINVCSKIIHWAITYWVVIYMPGTAWVNKDTVMFSFGSHGAHILEEKTDNKEMINKKGLFQMAMSAME